MFVSSSPSASSLLHAHHLKCPLRFPPSSLCGGFPKFTPAATQIRKPFKFTCRSSREEDYYLLDAPESVGDGFSFSGGKYSDGSSPADEWFKQGKMVKAYLVQGPGEKAKDPIFGLTMGSSSQASDDVFGWFCVESGSADNPSVVLIHGFPSQAYSYRKVLPVLSPDYHVIAFDWLGFGFSDKPQPKYGFDYTMEEYVSSLKSLLDELVPDKVSLVAQGYFAPAVVKYAFDHQDKVENLILLNPPITAKHANLPSALSIFSNFLLGEIFSQTYVEDMRRTLVNENWKVQTTVCWGQRDRWLNYDGVEDFCKASNYKLVELPMAGHHVQEDCGEELGQVLAGLIRKGRHA